MAAFNLLRACPINFVHGGSTSCKLGTYKVAEATVDKLTRESCSDATKGIFLNKLENSLMCYSGYEGQRFGDTLNRFLEVELFYVPRDKKGPYTGYLRVVEKEKRILRRFVGLCGGVENISVNLLLEFGTKEDKLTVEFKDSNVAWFKISTRNAEVYEVCMDFNFNFTHTLAKKWDEEKFSGKLTLSFGLNDEALNLIHRDNLHYSSSSLGSKMLEIAESTGDAIIVTKGRKRVRCHKAVLISQNEVFKMMFDKEESDDILKMNDMTEDGVRALISYLYCKGPSI